MIKVIVFDLGKVIVDFDYSMAVEALRHQTPCRLEEILSVLKDDNLIFAYETGRMGTSDFYQTVSRRLRLQVSMEDFKRLWSSMFLPEPLLSESLLVGLKRHHQLFLLSNTNELHFEFLEDRLPLLRHIENRVLSYREGCMKPDRQIYEIAVRRAGAAPEEIFFTDDRVENIESARQAGLWAVQFQSEPQLRQEMSRAGIAL